VQAFQKLVFVSQLVFGDQAKFLLPWKRAFDVNDSQVAVALRDNGLRIFNEQLKTLSGESKMGLHICSVVPSQLEFVSDRCEAQPEKQTVFIGQESGWRIGVPTGLHFYCPGHSSMLQARLL
jgi:hypothetical protein